VVNGMTMESSRTTRVEIESVEGRRKEGGRGKRRRVEEKKRAQVAATSGVF